MKGGGKQYSNHNRGWDMLGKGDGEKDGEKAERKIAFFPCCFQSNPASLLLTSKQEQRQYKGFKDFIYNLQTYTALIILVQSLNFETGILELY